MKFIKNIYIYLIELMKMHSDIIMCFWTLLDSLSRCRVKHALLLQKIEQPTPHKLCVILPANVKITDHLSHQIIQPYLYCKDISLSALNNSWKSDSVASFNMDYQVISKFYPER